MIKLYYSPFSCSMTIHIVLEMLGVPYEAIKVKTGSDEYKKIAYKGAVPALEDDDMPGVVLTQIPALLNYLLEKSKNKDLGSDGTLEGNYKLNNALAFINSDLHKSFGPSFASQKYTTQNDEEVIDSIREAGYKMIERQLGFLEEMLDGKTFLLGDKVTVADIYAFVVSNWANGLLPTKLQNYLNIRKLHEEITKIESVQKVIGIHKS